MWIIGALVLWFVYKWISTGPTIPKDLTFSAYSLAHPECVQNGNGQAPVQPVQQAQPSFQQAQPSHQPQPGFEPINVPSATVQSPPPWNQPGAQGFGPTN